MRFDRRRTYPLDDRNDQSPARKLADFVPYLAKIPFRKGGVVKVGPSPLPLNVAVGKMPGPLAYKFARNRFTSGGASSSFGSQPYYGSSPSGLEGGFTFIVDFSLSPSLLGSFDAPVHSPFTRYTCDIDWGDGVVESYVDAQGGDLTHSYENGLTGVYEVHIVGTFDGIRLTDGFSGGRIREVLDWGDARFGLGECIIGGTASGPSNVQAIPDGPLPYDGGPLDGMLKWGLNNVPFTNDRWDNIPPLSNGSQVRVGGIVGFSVTVDITGFDASLLPAAPGPGNRLNLSNAFTQVSGSGALDLSTWPNLAGTLITGADNTFESMEGISSVNVGAWNFQNGTIVRTFASSRQLTSIDLSALTTYASVGDYTSCFSNCVGLSSIDVTNLFANVTTPFNGLDLNGFFNGCQGLTSFVGFADMPVEQLAASNALNNFLNIVPLDTVTYDAMLIDWAPRILDVTADPQNANFGNAKYTSGGAAETARADIIAKGWTISDGGPV